jgi:hypothetical protein
VKTKIAAVAASALLCSLTGAAAMAAEETPEVYIYGSYFTCQGGMQADEAVKGSFKAVYDAAVADGTIKTWGWLQHHTGGTWSRVLYHTGPSQKAIMAALGTLDSRTSGEVFEAANKQFNQACGGHEDYIWRGVTGNDVRGDRGKVGLSVYYVCDVGREAQADALVKRVFAATYDKLVADGKLKAWGWWEHIVGGKYRRLATMTAADMSSLMEARAAIVQAMNDDPLADAFTDICGPHQDYLWNVMFQAP